MQTKLAEQDALSPHETPAVTSKQLNDKAHAITELYMRVASTPRPPPPKPKPKAKPAKTEEGANDETVEAENAEVSEM